MSNTAAKPHWLFIGSCKALIYRSCKRKLVASLCESSLSKQSSNWQVPVDFPPQSPLITRPFNYYMHMRGGNNLAAPPRFNYQAHTNSDPAWFALTKFCSLTQPVSTTAASSCCIQSRKAITGGSGENISYLSFPLPIQARGRHSWSPTQLEHCQWQGKSLQPSGWTISILILSPPLLRFSPSNSPKR